MAIQENVFRTVVRQPETLKIENFWQVFKIGWSSSSRKRRTSWSNVVLACHTPSLGRAELCCEVRCDGCDYIMYMSSSSLCKEIYIHYNLICNMIRFILVHLYVATVLYLINFISYHISFKYYCIIRTVCKTFCSICFVLLLSSYCLTVHTAVHTMLLSGCCVILLHCQCSIMY